MRKKQYNFEFLNYIDENANKLIQDCGEKWYIIEISPQGMDKMEKLRGYIIKQYVLYEAFCGELGWCFSRCPQIISNQINRLVSDFIEKRGDIIELDERISSLYSKGIILDIASNAKAHMNSVDIVKFTKAMRLFNNKDYYTCATILAGLIDSQSINQSLIDTTKENVNVSQCWKCYGKVIQEHFASKYFEEEFPYKETVKTGRIPKSISFFSSLKEDFDLNNQQIIDIISLSFSMLKFFDNSDWTDKLNSEIPSSVNRHWLAHGMYEWNDIRRVDCIKMILMLELLVSLYDSM
ncbi:hypothetical protein [Ruminococcus sp.]|uniref:hypothetical protein n=1 Tax=Ruminococcus sp. TaxID=41978 RepID=UPI0025E9F98C|nr:hypothetical protein [Ruminococcus sp.]